tara:strand:- start:837 stop:1154 length:318 start_codon:yes stop_codon:yes gene_type:complete
MPLWLLISVLQLFVPLVTILRACCIESVRHYTVHWLSSLLILIGVIVNLVTLKEFPEEKATDFKYYTVMVIVSCGLDVVSHTIKEILVRTQPLNQEKFNFKISFF